MGGPHAAPPTDRPQAPYGFYGLHGLTGNGDPPSVDAALTPGVVLVSAEGATEFICADPEQVGRAIAYFRTRNRRPWLRWRRPDGTLVRRAADTPLDVRDGPFA